MKVDSSIMLKKEGKMKRSNFLQNKNVADRNGKFLISFDNVFSLVFYQT